MKQKLMAPLSITIVVLFCTAFECATGSSGSSGGNSSGTTSYYFDSVDLFYDFSSHHSNMTDLYLDAGELYVAHDTNPVELNGHIYSLYKILQNSDNYSAERKPMVKISINTCGGDSVSYLCSKDDLGDSYVQNIPDYGAQINSLKVDVESITTASNALRLCWSKTFDLQQSWWELYSDKILSGEAGIKVKGYVKCIGSDEIIIVRQKNDGYQVNTYLHPDVMEVSSIDCDVEIVITSATDSPTLEQPIYIDGDYNHHVGWDEPLAITIIQPVPEP